MYSKSFFFIFVYKLTYNYYIMLYDYIRRQRDINDRYQRMINENFNDNLFINEGMFISEHGKAIDSVLAKVQNYTLQNVNRYINESAQRFNMDESVAAKDMLLYAVYQYREGLLKELSEYELQLNEGVLDGVKKYIDKGKETLIDGAKKIKTKVSEVTELLKTIAKNGINSVKEMVNVLLKILEKIGGGIKDLFEKIVGKEKIVQFEKDWFASADKMSDVIKKNPKLIEKEAVYENAARDYNNLINEDETVDQGEKKQGGWKEMLLKALKQFAMWAVVCVGIPGIFVAFFPGTYLALLVATLCKLAWSFRQIPKLWNQFKTIKSEWKDYNKKKKVIAVVSYVVMIGLFVWNVSTIASSAWPLLNAFAKDGFNLMAKSSAGIQPDVLVKGFASVVKMIKEGKFSVDDLGKAWTEIGDSFEQHISSTTEKFVKYTARTGQSADEILNNYGGQKFSTSSEVWDNFLHPSELNINPSNIEADGIYDVVFDGSSKADWAQKFIKWASDNGVELSPNDALNKGLNNICKKAGSLTGFKIPGTLLKKAMEDGLDLGHNSFGKMANGMMKGISIMGSVVDKSSIIKSVTNKIIPAIAQHITLPVFDFIPTTTKDGFQVKLGTGSDEYVYNVAADGVRSDKLSNHTEQYQSLRERIVGAQNEQIKKICDSFDNDDDKKKFEESVKNRQDDFKKSLDEGECIIFYGKRLKESANESFISLRDYLIMEGVTNQNMLDNLENIRRWLSDHMSWKDHSSLKDIFSKDKFKDANLGRDDKHLMAMLIYKGFDDIQYDPAAELITLVHKLYTKCASNNKVTSSKDDNNDITLEDKIMYNKIYDILSTISQFKKEVVDNKSTDILKKFKIKPKDPDAAKEKVDDLKKEIDKEKPNKDEIENTEKIIDNSDNLGDDQKSELKDIISDKNTGKTVDDSKDEQSEKDSNEETDKSDENVPDKIEQGEPNDVSDDSDDPDKLVPVLIIAKCYVMDLAKSNSSGPRKDIFTLKNIYDNYEFLLTDKGTSQDNVNKMLGDILRKQSPELGNLAILPPCDDKKNPTDGMDADTERDDLAELTNNEFIKLQNDKSFGKKLIDNGEKFEIASSPKDKKTKEQFKKESSDTVADDTGALEEINKVVPGVVDDNGNKDDKKFDDVMDKLSDYQLGRYKEKNNGKGFWGKVKRFFKRLFGDYDEDDLERIDRIVRRYHKKRKGMTNESLDEYVINRTHRSLSDYVKENMR